MKSTLSFAGAALSSSIFHLLSFAPSTSFHQSSFRSSTEFACRPDFASRLTGLEKSSIRQCLPSVRDLPIFPKANYNTWFAPSLIISTKPQGPRSYAKELETAPEPMVLGCLEKIAFGRTQILGLRHRQYLVYPLSPTTLK